MPVKILIMGLPGAGKTTLAQAIKRQITAVHFNADEVRMEINRELGFSHGDRVEHARRMGWLCDRVLESGTHAIADFVCPTAATRAAFGDAFIVWVDRIASSRFPDTDSMFEPPDRVDIRVTADGAPELWADQVVRRVDSRFDPRKPTALFVGRYQPFHAGHQALIEEGIRRIGQACVAVRDTYGQGTSNPFHFAGLSRHRDRLDVIQVPNVAAILFGRDVGYAVERIDLDEGLHAISATDIRRRMGLDA
jgi:adenylylsulfate kinase